MSVMNTSRLIRQLDQLGFQADGDEYHRNGLKARFESRWLTFRTKAVEADESNHAETGSPGLWKKVDSANNRPAQVFDLPLSAITQQEVWDEETGVALCPLGEMIDWVSSTMTGKLPTGWNCLPREELEQLLPSKALTLETGQFARHGQIHCEAGRLAVSFPLLQRVPADLSQQRRACLDRLLADVQNRSRLVRLVHRKTSEEVRSILAEVDLSGVPRFATSLLLHIGLDAVRHVVSQNISAVEMLVDPAVTSTVWDFPLVQQCSAEGS